LDGRDLYRHRLAADAIHRASYQRELVRTLGVEWIPADGHGNRELVGMSQELVWRFSKRTDQIDAELARLAGDGRERTPRLVKWAVHATRKPKVHQVADTLYGRWRTEAAERGHDPDGLVRQLCGRTRGRDQGLSERTVAAVFERLACPAGLTATASTFGRQDVIAALGGQHHRAPDPRRQAVLRRRPGRLLAPGGWLVDRRHPDRGPGHPRHADAGERGRKVRVPWIVA
jgi:hypothetical protein